MVDGWVNKTLDFSTEGHCLILIIITLPINKALKTSYKDIKPLKKTDTLELNI